MNEYSTVSELPEEEVPHEQIERFRERYTWAARRTRGKRILECGCGAGQGLQLLLDQAKGVAAGDYDAAQAARAAATYPSIDIRTFDAIQLPHDDETFDVVLLAEAIYYIEELDVLMSEVRRVLAEDGEFLVVTANKDLYDFNPSPKTFAYLGTREIRALFQKHKFDLTIVEGGTPLTDVSLRQRILRPLKYVAARLNLIPRTMSGKSTLKRLFFGGSFEKMPHKFTAPSNPLLVDSLSSTEPCTTHKVLYFVGTKQR